ncbi:MAG: protease [Clostridia bacterium]|nr:protease [Clostridia bacterium]
MRRKIFAGLLLAVAAAVLMAAFALRSRLPGRPGGGVAGESVGIIFIEGVITGGTAEGAFGGPAAGSQAIIEQLREARRDPNVKAVVLRLDTPGGSAPAAQEISVEVQRLRRAGKKVVASMGDAAASGGYWIASQADRIVANPATLTGSIGVIMQLINMQELYRKLGLASEVIKSGPHKDMGSPTRPLTGEEREILQGMVDDIYQQFLQVVAEGRGLPLEKVRQLADGRIYTGRQAKELGLVDELGNFYDAVRLAASLAGIEGEPNLRYFARPSPWDWLFRLFSQGKSALLPSFLPWKQDLGLALWLLPDLREGGAR